MQVRLKLRAAMAGAVASLLISAAAFATPIDDKYNLLGGAGSFLGAPTIPESTAPDGIGKYRHYAGGSIYWHPQTGAHEVHGLIRQLWSKFGCEKSYLGYPMTDEIHTFDGAGRVSKFQGGELIWRSATNKVSEVKSTDLLVDLPFAANEAWQIIQANAPASGSHRGPWVYCWDFILAGKPQSQSSGRTFVAAADAPIIYVEQSFPPGPQSSGNVVIQHLGTGRYASYLHIKTGSYSTHFGSGALFLPQAMPGQGPVAKTGTVLAEVGDTGVAAGAFHLHFCVTTKPDRPQFKSPQSFESVPVAFRNYSFSTDGGNKWTFVAAGVPRDGQWVRRENKGGPTAPQINASASVINTGTVSGQVSSLNGKAGPSGGTLSISVNSAWGEPLATKTINIPANSSGPWSYTVNGVPAFSDLKAAASYKGSWTVTADLIAGESGGFTLAPNGSSTANIQLKATAIK